MSGQEPKPVTVAASEATALGLQEQLHAAFAGRAAPPLPPSAATPLEACLRPLLDALHWTGDERRLFEASPHLEPIESIGVFRAVLLRIGFRTIPTRLALDRLASQFLPALVERHGGGAVVLERKPDGRMLVFDGITGNYQLEPASDRPEQIYLVAPAAPESGPAQRQNWFWQSLRSFRSPIAAVLLITFLTNLLALAAPIYTANVYDHVIAARSLPTLAFFLIAIVLAISFDFHLRAMKARLVAHVGARFHAALANAALEKVLLLPISMVEGVSVSTQIARFRQFESVRSFFSGHLVNALLDLPFMLLFFAALAWIGGVFVVVPLALVVVYAAIAAISIPLTRRNIAIAGQAQSRSQAFVAESLAKAETIRQLGVEQIWVERFRTVSRDAIVQKFRAQIFDSALQTTAQALSTLAGVATLGVGAVMVINGSLSSGGLIAVMMFIWRMLAPIQTALLGINNMNQFVQTLRQINALMRLQTERDPIEALPMPRRHAGRIVVDGVAFRYPGRGEPSLRGISLVIPHGEIVALTGSAGAGKSTLLKMILRFYPPLAGTVYLDGLNIQQIDPGELRVAIGYVPQQPTFFFGTVRQNLLLADPAADEARMRAALQVAGLGDLDARLPDGLETKILGLGRVGLPQGLQMQLALARAYLKRPAVLLLDNPGAYLDRNADEALIAALRALRGKTTVIVVTGRPSYMRACDRVVRIERGLIIADGTPEDVLAKMATSREGDVYQRMA
jgi:ATP-binding cassette, subfamily C, bacterial LapB